MKYYMDYEKETGKILGFIIDETKKQGEVVEVSKEQWNAAMTFNKISIDGENITFEKVDWRTSKEIEDLRIKNINSYTQSYIYSKYPQPKQSSANLGVYDESYKNEMVRFIRRIVDLSNEAITNGTSFEDYKVILEGVK